MVDIRPGVVRDVCFVAANMREKDREEIMCQLPPTPGALTTACTHMVYTSECWTAWYKDRPAAAFGVQAMNTVALNVWAFGTRHMWRTIPALTRFVRDERAPVWIEAGYRIMEARSLLDHHDAHRWMLRFGATVQGEAFPYGNDGEQFLLFRWTVPGYHSIRGQIR